MAAEDIINLDSSSEEEDAPQLENKENNNNPEEELHGFREEEGVNEIEQEEDDPNVQDMDLGDDIVVPKSATINSSPDIILIDQIPTIGVKRAHVERNQNEPSVRVVFRSLTRESKRKLMELMQQWSEWQAKHPSFMEREEEEALESGEEIFYPALHVSPSKSQISTVSFWIDNQARTDNVKDESSVPLYDREFTLGSSSLDGSAIFERSAKDDPRCFNCGSYSHPLKECPKPRDIASINSARKEHSAKRNLSNANNNHGPSRYYQRKPGKFDDLKPGVLGPETRESLGIGELDPPPWLHRMREMGYPPGYLEIIEDKDKPSGITIFTDKEERENNISDKKEDYEEGELPDRTEPGSSEKKMTVEIPGINAPIPEKADPFLWSVNPPRTPASIYPPRYNPYDQYNGSSSSWSPTLGRSLLDRGRYDGSLSNSPHSSYSYSYQYSTRDRGRDRDRDRDRDRELHDHRHHHHHRR